MKVANYTCQVSGKTLHWKVRNEKKKVQNCIIQFPQQKRIELNKVQFVYQQRQYINRNFQKLCDALSHMLGGIPLTMNMNSGLKLSEI